MTLVTGSRLGAYEIVSTLGAGGMGEVYRARDSKLGREVAIKVIHGAFASDPDRVARLQREAKVLASINHHHIAALYGMDHAEGQHFLIMELVEGETLADRLRRGPLPVEDALRIAIQICEALEAAHEKGIVHRDLKPANVKITPDDRVKVLDFGLAKAAETAPGSAANLANSLTLSMMASSAGLVLGTAAYMSPEQAKGLPADHRSDIFSFGIVLFEMLTGRQPFQGETAPDVMASILAREPDLGRLAPDLNPRIAELLRRCLEKNPKRRWQAIGDVRAELESIALAPRAPAYAAHGGVRPSLWKRAIPTVAIAIAAAFLGAVVGRITTKAPASHLARFSVTLPSGQQFTGAGRHMIAISPDGTHIVYNGAPGGLFVRALEDLDPKPLGSESGRVTEPVFSPDGLSLAYFAGVDRALKRVPVTGGTPVTICPATNPLGMSWEGGSLLYGQDDGRLMRVSEDGGEPETLVQLKGELGHGPHLLPDGDHLLFTLAGGTALTRDRWDTASIVVQSLKSAERRTLIATGTDASYVPTGHLVYVVGGSLFAIRFDAATATVSGGAVSIVEGIRRAAGTGAANFAFSRNGTLAYVSGPASGHLAEVQIAVAETNGDVVPLKLPPAGYQDPRVSRDGLRIAYSVDNGKESSVWIYPLSGESSPRRLTSRGNNRAPIWSPDGTRVVYQSDREGDRALYMQPADRAGDAERLTKTDPSSAHWPESWHGTTILFRDEHKPGGNVLSVLSLPDRTVVPFANVRSGTATDAIFSPDGHWVSYTREARNGSTIYVQSFPARTAAEYELPTLAGEYLRYPVWSAGGTTILYSPTRGGFNSVTVTTTPAFAFGNPVPLKKLFEMGLSPGRRQYDILPDGRLIGLIEPGQSQGGPSAAPPIHVVLNWTEELKRLVPTR